MTLEVTTSSTCGLSTCSNEFEYFTYDPSLAGNALFLTIHALLLPIQIALFIRLRTTGVSIAIILSLISEIVGYTGRVLMHLHPFNKRYYFMNLISLTIGPVFLAAAVYLCLARIIVVYTTERSRGFSLLQPRMYTVLFICCDFVSLVLQAAGGAIAATAEVESKIKMGSDIMVGGLAVQVASLLLFMVLSLEFGFRCWRNQDQLNPKHAELYRSTHFKTFLYALALATVCIFIRSVFRVAELSSGFGGHLANDEVTYMILEGALIIVASCALTILHPGIGFGKHAWEEGDWHFRARQEEHFEKGGFPLTREKI